MTPDLPRTSLRIPDWRERQTHPFSFTSHRSKPRRDLGKSGNPDSARRSFFISVIFALQDEFGGWVPFHFVADGVKRSLDLGLLGHCLSGSDPDLWYEPKEGPIGKVRVSPSGRRRVDQSIVEETRSSSSKFLPHLGTHADFEELGPGELTGGSSERFSSKSQVTAVSPAEEPLQVPSEAVVIPFGKYAFEVIDGPHKLYLANIKEGAALLAGRDLPMGHSVWKVGITGNLHMRQRALNVSFPPTTSIQWTVVKAHGFPERAAAIVAEQTFKTLIVRRFRERSLGREFFILNSTEADELFSACL